MRTQLRFAVARFNLIGWLGLYRCHTVGVGGSVRAGVLFQGAVVQPDALLRVLVSHGGHCYVTQDRYLEGPPELIVEVANTSTDEDIGPKRDLYRKFGVQEYIVWRVAERAVDWSVLRKGYYWPLDAGPDGIIRSEVFPGLWLDPQALVAGDAPRVLAVAQQGHGSPEHTAFVAELRRRAAGQPG